MSLILEALRKSEAERRRGSTPDVAMELPPAPLPRSQAAPAWLWPALLIGALALVGGWMWSQRDAASAASGNAPATAPSPEPALEAAAPPVVVARPAPAPVAPAAAPIPAPVATPVTATPAAAMASIPAPAPTPPRRLPAPPPLPAADTGIGDIADIDATSLPPVKLSMHMWDAVPGKRFVILDGQRLGEGDRNGELTVVAIERDGVVVERNGQRARVPLP